MIEGALLAYLLGRDERPDFIPARILHNPDQPRSGWSSCFPPREGGGLPKEERMHGEPITTSRPAVEAKVKWATLGTYLGSVAALSVLQAVNSDLSLIAFWPDWLETITVPLIPTAITAVSGFMARHTPRPDLPLSQR
ncbi:hypothetical protein ABT340_35750 [Streptosporangium sp. NPDC000239]|uniref:hypothetical protein n=1 Tax=Streptosporangium sp. NPDC000239 TaxID=3154248 RepID=UPI00331A3771